MSGGSCWCILPIHHVLPGNEPTSINGLMEYDCESILKPSHWPYHTWSQYSVWRYAYIHIYIYIYTYRTEINLCTCRQFANFLGKYRYQVTTSMYVLYVIPRFTLKRWDVNQAALNGNDHLRNGKRRARHWLLIFFVWMIFASTISYCRRIKHMIPKSPEREFGPKRFCECHICPSVTRKRGRCSFGG